MEYFDEPRLVAIDPAEAKAANRANWDARVPIHAGPGGYSLHHVADGRPSEVVGFDRDRLGDLAGLDVVHLQCHLGADTISLAHLGAASITGLDFSAPALAHAATLVARAGIEVPTRWVESDVYDAPAALGRRYDLVYTGVGALNWLPDIAGWARVVADCLVPGGRLHLFEAHPIFWAGADEPAASRSTRRSPGTRTRPTADRVGSPRPGATSGTTASARS